MKRKNILRCIICSLLVVSMGLSSGLTAFAATEETIPETIQQEIQDTIEETTQDAFEEATDEVVDETALEEDAYQEENPWIQTDDIKSAIFSTAQSDEAETNNMLSMASYDEGTFNVYLHPYLEGVFDENNQDDAVATITVNLFEDSEENWYAKSHGETLSNRVATAFVSGIKPGEEDTGVEVPVSDVPETFFLEAVLTLSDGTGEFYTESIIETNYTEEISWLRNADINSLINEKGIDPAYIENLSPEEDNSSCNFTVYKEDGAIIDDDASQVITKCEDGKWLLSGIPEGFLDKYPDNETLSHVSELIVMGTETKTEDGSIITVNNDSEESDDTFNVYPIVCTAYRALEENPLNRDDYEYKYDIEYVYGNGTDEEPTGVQFRLNEDPEKADLVQYEHSISGTDETENIQQWYEKEYFGSDYTVKVEARFSLSSEICTVSNLDEYDMIMEIVNLGKITIKSGDVKNPKIEDATYNIGEWKKSAGEINKKFENGEVLVYGNFQVSGFGGVGELSEDYREHFIFRCEDRGGHDNSSNTVDVIRLPELKAISIHNTDVEKPLHGTIKMNTQAIISELEFHNIEDKQIKVEGKINFSVGSTLSGIKNNTKAEGEVHLCNETGQCRGCVIGDITDGLRDGTAWLSINGFNSEYKYKSFVSSAIYYNSIEFDEFGLGTCPYIGDPSTFGVTATPPPGVYKYNEKGLDITLNSTTKAGEIYYAVVNPNEKTETEVTYQKYTGPVHLDFTPGDSMDNRRIKAYLMLNGQKYGETEFSYIMLGKGIECLMYPKSVSVPVGGSELVTFIYPSTSTDSKATWSGTEDTGKISYEEVTTYREPGIEVMQVTGVKEGTVTLKATFNKASATCDVTVNDDLTKPVATYGTGFYLLKEIDIEKMQIGDYKDGNVELETNAPYFYHNNKHCIGEVLGHLSWGESSKNVKIYYTTDGSEPEAKVTDKCKEYKRGEKIYLNLAEGESYGIVSLKAIAYEPSTGKMSDTATFYYVIVDDFPDLGGAIVLMLPESKHLSHFGLGLCLAAYIPSVKDLLNRDNWTLIKPKWMKDENKLNPIPCFQVEWSWWSDGWLTVPVFGTTEWQTEPILGFDLIQVGLVFGLRETGKDDFVKITATGKCNSYDKVTNPGGKATGTCKVYVYDDDDPETRYFAVDYDLNGGSGDFATQTKKRGQTIKLHSETPTMTGYTFKGWTTGGLLWTIDYQPGDSYRRDESVTLHAVWERTPGKYIIKYDANGGTGAPANQEKTEGESVRLSLTEPTRGGREFLGWSEYKDSKVADCAPGSIYTEDRDITLYAVWTPETPCYVVKYDANGGKDAPPSQTKEQDVIIQLSDKQPTREGYEFIGWADSKNPSLLFDLFYPADESPKLYAENANVTLYAIWAETEKYVVEYDANGGSGAPAFQVVERTKDTTISTTVPTRTGYTFKGWATDKSATAAEYQPGAAYTARENITLYAVWQKDAQYASITYHANGGIGAPETQTGLIGSKINLSSSKPTRTGYTFKGWGTSDSATTASYQPGAQADLNSDMDLYAVWEKLPETVTLKYNANGGTNAPSEQIANKGEKVKISTVLPSREEFRFLGWSEDKTAKTAQAQYAPGAEITLSEDKIFYAVWVDEWTVGVINGTTKDGNVIEAHLENDKLTVTANTPEEGSRFIEWTVVSGNLTLTEAQAKSTTIEFNMPASDVILMANEAAIPILPHTIEVVNGTVNGITKGDMFGGTALNVAAISSGGMTFSHWEAEGITLTDAQKVSPSFKTVMPDNDVKLVAVYETTPILPHKIEVVYGLVNGLSEADYFAGTSLKVKACPAVGMTFSHWEAEGISLTDEQIDSEEFEATMPDNDVKLTAIYESTPILPHTITVTNGTVNGVTKADYFSGTALKVAAYSAGGVTFSHWEAEGMELTDEQKNSTMFEATMPDNDVKLKAVYQMTPIYPHKLTVVNGTIGDGTGKEKTGSYFSGASVTVTAEPDTSKYVFVMWTVTAGDIELTLEQATSKTFTFVMPDEDVELTAVYIEVVPTADNNNMLIYLIIEAIAGLTIIATGVIFMRKRRIK